MPDDWSWTPDETGLDDADAPYPFCGEPACERACAAALAARVWARQAPSSRWRVVPPQPADAGEGEA